MILYQSRDENLIDLKNQVMKSDFLKLFYFVNLSLTERTQSILLCDSRKYLY